MTRRRIRSAVRTGAAAIALMLGASWMSSLGAARPPGESRPPGPSDPSLRPAGAERWLYNPRERAARGLEELRGGRSAAAIEAFDTAVRLAPDDPVTLYDAATARLVTERQPVRAAELLTHAAETAPPRLAPHALYNLGNARLTADDPAAAADAYRRALRLAPDLQPAKRNLEIALRRLERDRAAEPPPRELPEDEERPAESDGFEGGGRQSEPRDGGGAAGTLPPHFERQPDMTAVQAAALLAAIDDLERRQRRRQAAETTTLRRGKDGKDW